MKIFALTVICALVAICLAQTSQTFIKEALQAHNKYRADHGAAPLRISNALNAAAQQWANHLASVDSGLTHSKGTGQGENLAGGVPGAVVYNGATLTARWYSEVSNYDFNTGRAKNGGVIGHFTQIVWKGTTQLGVATATSKRGGIYYVTRYSPPGNYVGEKNYLQNVGKRV